MTQIKDLGATAKTYVILVVCTGFAIIAHSIYWLYLEPIGVQWLAIAALTLLTGSFTVKVPSINASLSVSETFVFASVLLFGAPAGAVTVLLECLIILLWMKPYGRPIYLILFNTAAPAVAIWVSGSIFFLVSGLVPYSTHTAPLQVLFLPLLLFTTLYFLLNSSLVAVALGFETNQSPLHIWWSNFPWLSVNYFSGASVAALLVTYTTDPDLSTLAIIVPLLVVSYLTFRTAMGRVEDSNKHLSELNRLYLSTIETLAMAIDAKDQITHGHIRRVQTYAVGLAQCVGVSDPHLIKAIEAAALLHDMGKLAVPEHILNKPGKLTTAEFDKMKLHASVGADILSAIEFPYPVVPIVRHHHENWDGTGYPLGLKETDIPLGARILSVVDCFDALTSDRPYRPRLTDDDALRILAERRGSMYDPVIVDTFSRVYKDIAPTVIQATIPGHVLNEITGATQSTSTSISDSCLEDISASTDEMVTLYELARALAGQASISDTGDIMGKHLRRLVPFSIVVLYLYDVETDALIAQHAIGDASTAVRGLRIPLGQRLSGWVAANRKTIVNSDPTLDLGGPARFGHPRLRSSLSSPLLSGEKLVGVLTLYCETPNAFNEDHRRIVEAVARLVGHTLKCNEEFDMASRRDVLTGLPSLSQLEQLLQSGPHCDSADDPPLTLLFIDVVAMKAINATHGRHAGDDVLRHVAHHARTALRAGDILFRCSSDEFVALLENTDTSTAEVVAARVRESIRKNPLSLGTVSPLTVRLEVTSIAVPHDGRSLRELMTAAHLRIASQNRRSPPSIH